MTVVGRTGDAEGAGDQAECTEPRRMFPKLTPQYWKYRLLQREGTRDHLDQHLNVIRKKIQRGESLRSQSQSQKWYQNTGLLIF